MSLTAQWHGSHILVRHRDEPGWTRAFLTWAPTVRGEPLVVASERAEGEPVTGTELGAMLRPLLSDRERTPEVKAVWLGIAGLAGDPERVWTVCRELDVEVLAPDGTPVMKPGAALYAGPGTGGTGWYRFRAGLPGRPAASRYPPPRWEVGSPTEPVNVNGVVAMPIPAGWVVRHRWAPVPTPEDDVFTVPVDHRFPKIVVGGAGPVPEPTQVAAVVEYLRPDRFLVVPASPEAATHVWQAELAVSLRREIVFSAGIQSGSTTGLVSTFVPGSAGARRFRPWATVIRQPAGGGDQEVLEAAAPPAGWVRHGPRSYRCADEDGRIVVDVVPSGVVIRRATASRTSQPLPFDPERWTLDLGVTGERIGSPVLRAAERLLTGLDAERRASVRVRVVGTLEESVRTGLTLTTTELRDAVAAVTVRAEPPHRSEAGTEAPDSPPASSRGEVPSGAAASLIPVPTVSSGPVGSGSLVEELPGLRKEAVPESVAPENPIEAGVSEPPVGETDSARAAASVVASVPPDKASAADPPTGEATADLALSEPEPAESATPPEEPVVVDRPSTPAERTRFATAAGEQFTEALAATNASMATWPSLRQENDHGVKTDYAAVLLYFGTGDGAATRVNHAMRAGEDTPLDGHVPCLVSGIRRLPIHRRPVLRQGLTEDAIERHGKPGTVLVEPGFLSASMDLDVTVSDALFDVLIWPNSARRTTELLRGELINEAIFMAGARFKALAFRAMDDPPEPEPGKPVVPRKAVLLRELAPQESSDSTELTDRDLTVLTKLDRELARRRQAALRAVEDTGVISRLTAPLLEWRAPVASPNRDRAPVEIT